MIFPNILLFLTWQLYAGILTISAIDIGDKKCRYRQTVNLTNHQRFENGSYVYKAILIPPERQAVYDADYFLGNKKSVPEHVRGCVCDQYSCVKLCCAEDEYFNVDSAMCEKLMANTQVLWDIRIEEHFGKYKTKNILKDFTTVKYGNCWQPKTLTMIADNWTFSKDGLLRTNDGILDISEFCFSPSLMANYIYILKPYTCRLIDDGTRKLIINGYSHLVSVLFLLPTLLLYIFLQELKENLAGKIFFFCLFSMTMANVLFCCAMEFRLQFNSIVLLILEYTGYILQILAILWLSVVSYHIWQNLENIKNVANKNRQFIIYCLYVGLSAILATSCMIYMNPPWILANSYMSSVAETNNEWLNFKKWTALNFYGATVLILVFNFYKFVRLTIAIYKKGQDMAGLKHNKKLLKKNTFIVLRLFLIMDMPCCLKVISHYICKGDFLFGVVNFSDGIQGFMIFCVFALRQEIWRILKEKRSYNVRVPQENCIDIGTAADV